MLHGQGTKQMVRVAVHQTARANRSGQPGLFPLLLLLGGGMDAGAASRIAASPATKIMKFTKLATYPTMKYMMTCKKGGHWCRGVQPLR
jgi:hypothetical protein